MAICGRTALDLEEELIVLFEQLMVERGSSSISRQAFHLLKHYRRQKQRQKASMERFYQRPMCQTVGDMHTAVANTSVTESRSASC